MSVGNGREPFLLHPPILARSGNTQTQTVAPKGEARLGVLHRNGAVVDAEKQPVRLLPARVALAGWKLNQLERVPIGNTSWK